MEYTRLRCDRKKLTSIDFAVLTEGKRLVVIGSSFISMELVVAVTKRNLASIDVIGMESAPFEAVLGKEVGAALQKVCFYLYAPS